MPTGYAALQRNRVWRPRIRTQTWQIPFPRLADDLLTGVPEIADYLGEYRRRVYNLVERDRIPAFRVGTRWHARKSQLDRHCQPAA